MRKRPRRQPRQGILRFVIRYANGEVVTARAGLPLLVEAARAVRLDKVVEQKLKVGKRQRGFSDVEKLEALLVLLAAGGDRVEDIRILAEDKGLQQLLGKELPSPDALLDFLHGFHDESLAKQRPKDALSWVPEESAALLGLAEVNRVLVERAATAKEKTATIDHDGTIIESHRQGARVAYEGTRGYQPLVAVWAEQDLIVCDEFRDGNVPGDKDPLSSVKRAFEALPSWVERRYFRADSADYSTAVLKYLVNEGIGFSISADMSTQLRACCTAVPEKQWTLLEVRPRELVHTAEVEFTSGEWPKGAAPLRYVALRFTPRQQALVESEAVGAKYLAVVTNRPAPEMDQPPKGEEMTAAELVRWHWGKAGTIEHVHRSLKDELGAGVLPSSCFAANAAWFRINVLCFNLLTLLRRRALPERYRDARPKRLRFELFTLPGRLTSHQSQLALNISAEPARIEEMVAARGKLLAMRQAIERKR